MIEIRQTEVYAQWFDRLRDRQARARIDTRIRRLSFGQSGRRETTGRRRLGTTDRLRSRIPGVFVRHDQALVILLAGGDKRTQDRDITRALELAREL
jgi:putative addiction module killer protein